VWLCEVLGDRLIDDAALDEEMLPEAHGDADVSDFQDHDSVYSYEDCLAGFTQP